MTYEECPECGFGTIYQNHPRHWVFTFRVEPPENVVSARNGASVFFAAYCRSLRRWQIVYPGGSEQIDEPEMIFVSNEYAKEHAREKAGRRPTIRLREGKRKAVQLELAL